MQHCFVRVNKLHTADVCVERRPELTTQDHPADPGPSHLLARLVSGNVITLVLGAVAWPGFLNGRVPEL